MHPDHTVKQQPVNPPLFSLEWCWQRNMYLVAFLIFAALFVGGLFVL